MFTIRKVEERDKQAILDVTKEVGVFTRDDVGCVDELLDTYLQEPEKDEYTFIAACDESDRLLGYLCYGPTPLTEGTYDFYWLAVNKTAQGQGIANALFERGEQELTKKGARLVVLETSSTSEYAPARRLYERRDFTGRI